MADKVLLETGEELERELIVRAEGFLSNDGLHCRGVTTDGVLGVELVRDVAVVVPGELLADGRLHQSRERREDVNGGVNLTVVELRGGREGRGEGDVRKKGSSSLSRSQATHLTINEDLALRDVARKIRNRVGDV